MEKLDEIMNVLMLNTFDAIGGAARAASRLLEGVRKHNIDAKLLVQFKTGKDRNVVCNQNSFRELARRIKILAGTLPVRRYPNKPVNNFSPSLLPDRKLAEVAALNPDIIHLHWLCAGFLRVETLAKFNKPLVWSLHDSWAFTGGCHVPYDCTQYRQSCGMCPILGSDYDEDLSRRTWKRKEKNWRSLNLTVVAPSRWMVDSARSSSLFRNKRIERIPYGLDIERFRPIDKRKSRQVLGLPQDKKIILFGAVQAFSDPNKGFHLLRSALQIAGQGTTDKVAVVFSAIDRSRMVDLGMPAVFLGRVNDDLLPTLYSAADVFVLPSKQENLPLTILEAMACGTPCVAFHQGGLPDQVDHLFSGYLARPFEIEDLAKGISWVLENGKRHLELSRRARQKVKTDFNQCREASRYAGLYRELLDPDRDVRNCAEGGHGKVDTF